jgi:hypothetical protein
VEGELSGNSLVVLPQKPFNALRITKIKINLNILKIVIRDKAGFQEILNFKPTNYEILLSAGINEFIFLNCFTTTGKEQL